MSKKTLKQARKAKETVQQTYGKGFTTGLAGTKEDGYYVVIYYPVNFTSCDDLECGCCLPEPREENGVPVVFRKGHGRIVAQ